MKKLLLLLFIPIILLVGCSEKENVFEGIDTHIVTDCVGREVELPIEINKIGCIYAISGHTTVMLGEGEKIVSVTSGLKRDKVLTEIVPGIMNATEPKSGGSINIEELLKDKPDVVFVRSDIALNEREAQKLEKFNIPYLAIEFDSIEKQQFMIRMIGKVLNKEERAEKYISYYNDTINYVESKTKTINEDEKVRVYHSINEATRTDPLNSVPADWFSKAGCILVSTTSDLKYMDNDYYASLEQILDWNPEAIFVNEDGVDKYILNDSKWQSIDAVKSEKVYLLPNGVSRWGHPNSLEIPLAMLWTSKKLYPNLFEDLDMNAEVSNFYNDFFNIELDKEEIEKILEGKGMRLNREDV
ncbi:ABC transporter substrate-binding protein [Clostridiaceae bacterium HSG29]|nr:ABC transporter substrate-binding protein [Clostridiaceae bacterium HSG29]